MQNLSPVGSFWNIVAYHYVGLRGTLRGRKNHENHEISNFNVLDHFWQVLKDISCLSSAVTRAGSAAGAAGLRTLFDHCLWKMDGWAVRMYNEWS